MNKEPGRGGVAWRLEEIRETKWGQGNVAGGGAGGGATRGRAASGPSSLALPRPAGGTRLRVGRWVWGQEGPYPCAACPAARPASPSEECALSRHLCSTAGSRTPRQPSHRDHRLRLCLCRLSPLDCGDTAPARAREVCACGARRPVQRRPRQGGRSAG